MNRGGYIKRRTPMPPPTKPMKRSRLRPVSKKKRDADRENKAFLDAYRKEFPLCQCGCGRQAVEIHEIPAGAQFRWKARRCLACLLHLARRCHRRLQGAPYILQLAIKWLSDPAGYSLLDFLRVIGREPTAITRSEVMDKVAEIYQPV